ncbi:MAG: AMP-binding protein [Ferroplasma sp.]|uniref:AMP-binding protein n=1 Tax=Ferroplasma sp. TaxID=2591003 RepID=UPI0028164ABC|nr:AMP-binding protein [Ferroplasma sp.]WMT50870.1 MAG: AMP-binding protein [Ferroplasma sp.]
MEFLDFYREFINSDTAVKNQMLGNLKTMEGSTDINFVTDVFEQLFAKLEKDAVIYVNTTTGMEKRISYREFVKNYNKFINFLRSNGIKKGSNIYIMAGPVPEQWTVMMDALKAGYTVIPTAPNLTEYELNFRFSQDPPDVIISDENSASKLEKSLKGKPLLIIVGHRKGWNSFEDVDKMPPDAEGERLSTEDIFVKYFTSGTTGMPKAVRHSAILYPLGQLSTLTAIGIKSDYIHCNLSSPGWAKFAWSSFFAPLCAGATVLSIDYSGRLDSAAYLRLIYKYNVNSFCAPPTAWRQFLSLKDVDVSLGNLRETVSAGEPLNGEIINRWKNRYGTLIRDFYGQSESTAMLANLSGNKLIPGSMGLPLGSYNIALVDDEMNEITEPDTIGNMAVKDYRGTFGLFLGYSDSDKNSQVFINNYYLTGDRAYRDAQGYYYFVSRSDDVIKTSDYRVGPFEVESAIIKNEAVLESAVIGVPDPMKYEKIKAFIVLKEGYNPDIETAKYIHETVKSFLPYYKQPRIIEFTEELPKTISGKIKRHELREIEQERRNNNVAVDHEFRL